MPVDISTTWQTWIWFAVAGFGIATALAAAIYALGAALMNDKMKVWAKTELVEIFYSAVILLVAQTLLVSAVNAVVESALYATGNPPTAYVLITNPSGPGKVYQQVDLCSAQLNNEEGYKDVNYCHARIAIYYLRSIYDEGKRFGSVDLISYAWTSFAGETSITIQTIHEKSGFTMWTPWKGFYSIKNNIREMTFDWATTVMFLTKFQEIMIRFTAIAAFPLLFVAGVLLRTLTFTRRLGGLLIGLAIALLFVYPAFYAFGGLVMIELKKAALPQWQNSPANVMHTNDPPIINTLYINQTDDKKIGSITVLEKMSTQQKTMDDWDAMTPEQQADALNKGLAFDFGKTGSSNSKTSILDKMQGWYTGFTDFFSTKHLVDSMTPMDWRPGGYIDVVARLTFFSLFFALFGILGTIAATRSLSESFGGDIELAGLTRLI